MASFTTVSRATRYPPRCRTEPSQASPGRVGSGPILRRLGRDTQSVSQQRKRHVVAERRAHDDPQEDPGVVGHDAQHQHVAQRHLHQVEQRLRAVQQYPAWRGRERQQRTGIISREVSVRISEAAQTSETVAI